MADLHRIHTDDLTAITRHGVVTAPVAIAMAIEMLAWRKLFEEAQHSDDFARSLAEAYEEARRG